MKVYHGFHQTAHSRRTSGYPLKFYDAEGNLTREARTTKAEVRFDVPDSTVWAVWFYESNSGKSSVTVFDVTQGKLDETEQDDELVSQMAQDVDEWMAPTV
jgi:hypothetical protein